MYSKPVLKGHHTIREKVSLFDICLRFINMERIVHRSEKVFLDHRVSPLALSLERRQVSVYQCVSAGCDIHVQCCGSVTYVCTCVLAGSLLQRTGE